METRALEIPEVRRLLLAEEQPPVDSGGRLPYCSAADLFEVAESIKKQERSQKATQRMREGTTLFQNEVGRGAILLAPLDAQALVEGMFDETAEADRALWSPAARADIPPLHSVRLISFRACDRWLGIGMVEEAIRAHEKPSNG